jgi:hypothetical protein
MPICLPTRRSPRRQPPLPSLPVPAFNPPKAFGYTCIAPTVGFSEAKFPSALFKTLRRRGNGGPFLTIRPEFH